MPSSSGVKKELQEVQHEEPISKEEDTDSSSSLELEQDEQEVQQEKLKMSTTVKWNEPQEFGQIFYFKN